MKARDLRSESEKKYLEKAKSGDERAFEELVRSHDAFVSSVCLSILKNPHLAEDAAQETFIKAWRGISRFKGNSAFSTWLFTIAKNVCRDALAKTVDTEELSEEISDSTSVESEVIKNDEVRLVHESLSQLSEDVRNLLILREWQGLSYSEISEVLNISEGTVKSRLSRAREKLLEVMRKKM